MSNIMICIGKYADNPYYFHKFSLRIWSVEELCYFLVSNPFILDDDILDKGLVEWIEKECDLKELSQNLYSLLNKPGSAKLFVLTILDYVGYCTQKEQGQMERILQDNTGLSIYIKQKNKADYLVKSGKYALGILAYDTILEELPDSEQSVRADIYHNKGVACSKLFMYEKAAGFFETAYEMSGEQDSLRQMLLAKRHHMSENEYVAWMDKYPEYYKVSMKVEKDYKQAADQFEATQESRMLFTLKVYREEGKLGEYYEEIGKQIEKLKMDYINADGNEE